eukprot:GHVR01103927.1.p1 GENE.GHVR01103927.1~~GHVR01103927.1.p1  ORF type:complete len:186 (+),score=10.63 GHVR01103927.1:309-866(+)
MLLTKMNFQNASDVHVDTLNQEHGLPLLASVTMNAVRLVHNGELKLDDINVSFLLKQCSLIKSPRGNNSFSKEVDCVVCLHMSLLQVCAYTLKNTFMKFRYKARPLSKIAEALPSPIKRRFLSHLMRACVCSYICNANSGVIAAIPKLPPTTLASSEIFEEWNLSPSAVHRCLDRFSRTEQRGGK